MLSIIHSPQPSASHHTARPAPDWLPPAGTATNPRPLYQGGCLHPAPHWIVGLPTTIRPPMAAPHLAHLRVAHGDDFNPQRLARFLPLRRIRVHGGPGRSGPSRSGASRSRLRRRKYGRSNGARRAQNRLTALPLPLSRDFTPRTRQQPEVLARFGESVGALRCAGDRYRPAGGGSEAREGPRLLSRPRRALGVAVRGRSQGTRDCGSRPLPAKWSRGVWYLRQVFVSSPTLSRHLQGLQSSST